MGEDVTGTVHVDRTLAEKILAGDKKAFRAVNALGGFYLALLTEKCAEIMISAHFSRRVSG